MGLKTSVNPNPRQLPAYKKHLIAEGFRKGRHVNELARETGLCLDRVQLAIMEMSTRHNGLLSEYGFNDIREAVCYRP